MPVSLFCELRVAMDDKKPGLPYPRQPVVIFAYIQKKPTSIRKQYDFLGISGTAGVRK